MFHVHDTEAHLAGPLIPDQIRRSVDCSTKNILKHKIADGLKTLILGVVLEARNLINKDVEQRDKLIVRISGIFEFWFTIVNKNKRVGKFVKAKLPFIEGRLEGSN